MLRNAVSQWAQTDTFIHEQMNRHGQMDFFFFFFVSERERDHTVTHTQIRREWDAVAIQRHRRQSQRQRYSFQKLLKNTQKCLDAKGRRTRI